MSKVQTLKIYFNDPVSPELADRLIDDLIELVESHGLTIAAFWSDEDIDEEVRNGEPPE